MLGDTLTLPHASGNIVCNKINQDSYSSEYLFKDTTHQVVVKVRHSRTKASNGVPSRDRHNVELTETVWATDLDPEIVRKSYFVMELAPDDTDVLLMDALADWAIASADAKLIALVGWQS